MIDVPAAALEVRARASLGSSEDPIYRAVETALRERGTSGTLADIGCGRGHLWTRLQSMFTHCIGVDAVRYADLAAEIDFQAADLDRVPFPLGDASADVVAAVETIEHLENPRAFFRELQRIVRPGGWVVVTTPNQLSVLSLLTLVVKQRFSAFQDAAYPAHRTALLEVDLRRIAAECGLQQIDVAYTMSGRVPWTPLHYPAPLSRLFPRALSDNVLLIGRRHE